MTEFQFSAPVNHMDADDLKRLAPSELLANLPNLSSAEVDVLLTELLSDINNAELAELITEPQIKEPQLNLEELLQGIDQLSEQNVDSLIAELLAEENKKYGE